MSEFEQKKYRYPGVCLSRSSTTQYYKTHFEYPTLTASPEQPNVGVSGPDDASTASGAEPFTAVLLEARSQTESCRVPQGQYGASKVARYRILDFNGRPVNRAVTVGERFTKIEGADNIFNLLQPVSRSTDAHGFFNDCYRLFQTGPFPAGFRLKVEQNHLIGSEVISKNHITYTPDNVLLCIFRRSRRRQNFDERCRNF